MYFIIIKLYKVILYLYYTHITIHTNKVIAKKMVRAKNKKITHNHHQTHTHTHNINFIINKTTLTTYKHSLLTFKVENDKIVK